MRSRGLFFRLVEYARERRGEPLLMSCARNVSREAENQSHECTHEDERDSDTDYYLTERLVGKALSEQATAIPESFARHDHQSLTSVFLRTV